MDARTSLSLLACLIFLVVPGQARAQSDEDAPQKQGEVAAAAEDPHKIAERIRADLRIIDGAIDQWAIEWCKTASTPVKIKELAQYFKPGSALQKAAENGQFVDALGNPITVTTAEVPPALSQKTFDQLSTVVPVEFWKPYTVAK